MDEHSPISDNPDARLLADGASLTTALEAHQRLEREVSKLAADIIALEMRILDAAALTPEGREVRFSVGGQYTPFRAPQSAERASS